MLKIDELSAVRLEEEIMRSTVLFLMLLAAMFLTELSAFAAEPLVLRDAPAYSLRGAAVEILEDPGRQLTINDVVSPRYATQFTSSRRNILNFGMTDAAFWLRFTVDPGSRSGEPWLLLLENPLMSEVDLYIPRTTGGFDVKRSGDHISMSQREINEQEILLPLPLGTAPRTFYLRTWMAGRAQVPLTVLTREAFLKHKASQNFFLGSYAGFMLVMLLLGGALFVLLQDRNYLLYACYAATKLLTYFGLNSYLYVYFLPEHPLSHEYVMILVAIVSTLTGLLFADRFLRLTEYTPVLHRLVGWLAGLNLLLLLLCPAIPMLLCKKMLIIDVLVGSVLTLIAACISYRKGFLPARYYAYGRFFVAVFGVIFFVVSEGELPLNMFTKNILLLASVGDVLFILLAIGHHFSIIRRQSATLVTDLEREVAERTSAIQALKMEMSERIRLEREVLKISDNERRSISHQLHDGLCQQLTGIRIHFAALEDRVSGNHLGEQLHPMAKLLDDAVEHAYDLSRGLWPTDIGRKGIQPDLYALTRELSAFGDVPIRIEQHYGCASCCGDSLVQVCHIIREAVVNAFKHAEATCIAVVLRCNQENGIFLEIRDDGCGMGQRPRRNTGGGMGVSIMKHRAVMIDGKLTLAAGADGGTVVVCTAPCCGRVVKEGTDA